MTKKELEKRIEDLLEERGELRYKVNDYNELKEKAERLDRVVSKLEGAENAYITFMQNRIKNLTLRLDILTMTPDQIETMRKVKHRGRLEDPLDMGATGRIRDGRKDF